MLIKTWTNLVSGTDTNLPERQSLIADCDQEIQNNSVLEISCTVNVVLGIKGFIKTNHEILKLATIFVLVPDSASSCFVQISLYINVHVTVSLNKVHASLSLCIEKAILIKLV